MKSIVLVIQNLLKPYIDNADKKTQQIIATVDNADNASQNYALGDYVIHNGVLYKVKQAITSGSAFVVDTNIEAADDLTTQIKGLDTIMTGATAGANGSKGYPPVPQAGDQDKALFGDATYKTLDYVALKGLTELTSATNLNSLTTIGNYYKALTTFAVTNAPDDIDDDVQATFGIEVKKILGASGTEIQQIITSTTGEMYVRTYGGSAWDDWKVLDTYIKLDSTLAQGSTSVTFTDSRIKADSDIDVLTSTGVGYTAISGSSGSVTITFEAQAAAIDVGIRIR